MPDTQRGTWMRFELLDDLRTVLDAWAQHDGEDVPLTPTDLATLRATVEEVLENFAQRVAH